MLFIRAREIVLLGKIKSTQVTNAERSLMADPKVYSCLCAFVCESETTQARFLRLLDNSAWFEVSK